MSRRQAVRKRASDTWRSVFKIAISNHRIVGCKDGKVTSRYRKPKSRRTRSMILDAFEFIRRFLQHVLPSGFMKVRHHGFMNTCSGVSLGLVRTAVELMQGFDVKEPEVSEAGAEKQLLRCPDCGGSLGYCYLSGNSCCYANIEYPFISSVIL